MGKMGCFRSCTSASGSPPASSTYLWSSCPALVWRPAGPHCLMVLIRFIMMRGPWLARSWGRVGAPIPAARRSHMLPGATASATPTATAALVAAAVSTAMKALGDLAA